MKAIDFGGPPEFAFAPGERAALPRELATHAAALGRLVIALDGPGGSGKSSTARAVARRLGSLFMDTGAMYRAVTLLALRQGVALDDATGLADVAARHKIDLAPRGDGVQVLVDGADVSEDVRRPDVTAAVSRVAAHAEVRSQMVARQRQLGRERGVVVEGRDIGTVVFPDANVKVFVTADLRTRAERRQLEDLGRGIERPLDAIESELVQRDALDSERQASPLRRAADAVLLDTSRLGFEAQVEAVLCLAVRAVRGQAKSDVWLELADAQECRQPGYRPFRSLLFRFVHGLLRVLLRSLLGARYHCHPAARMPGSVLVACNHIAGLDPVVGGSGLPFETWFIAKLELFRNPFLARLIARFNAIPIRRGTADFEALDRAVALLGSGHNVFMFPEGTRQRAGTLGTPRWGFGYVAAKSGRPIVPVFVRGTRDLRPRLLRRQPIEVRVGEPVVVRIAPDCRDEHAIHKAIGMLVMERIAGLMLRSAAGQPLPGLELPGSFAGAPIEPTEISSGT